MDKYHVESVGDYCTDDHLCSCPRCRPYQQDEYEQAMEDANQQYIDIDQEQEEDRHENPYTYELGELIRKANRAEEYYDLAGGFDFQSPLQDLEDALKRAFEEVYDLRHHEHIWSRESGFCMVCGRDGNA